MRPGSRRADGERAGRAPVMRLANDCEQRKPDVSERHWLWDAVVEDELSRPERLAQVNQQHGCLIQQVRPRAHVGIEPDGLSRSGPHQRGQDEPRHGEPDVQPCTSNLPQRGARDEHVVVQSDDHWRGEHRFLAGHPCRAREDRCGMPTRWLSVERSHAAVTSSGDRRGPSSTPCAASRNRSFPTAADAAPR